MSKERVEKDNPAHNQRKEVYMPVDDAKLLELFKKMILARKMENKHRT